MGLEAFKKIVSNENVLHNFVGILVPMIIFSILFWIYESETENNLPLYTWVPIVLYIIIFPTLYEKKFFMVSINKKTSKYFFEKLTFEGAVIRFEYAEKFQKYSVIALIIITIIVAIGILVTMHDKDVQLDGYYDQQELYENEVKDTYDLSEKELREYFHQQISKMSTLNVDQRIVTILGNELLEENENTNFAEFHTPGNQFLWDTPDDLDRRQFLHEKYDEMTYDELKEILSKKLEKLKPSPFIDGLWDYTFMEFLIFVLMIPLIQVYSIFLFRYSLTKHSDFYYLLSKGCFSILTKYYELDQITKRKYLLMGLHHYEKFVKKNTNLNINRFNEIKSVCVNYDSENITHLSHNFVECLEKNNNLELLSYVQDKIHVSDTSQFLIRISLAAKLKEKWHIIATGISTLFTGLSYITNVILTTPQP